MSMEFASPCNARTLAQALVAPALGIIRAKGHVTDHSGAKMLIQIVGERYEITAADIPAKDEIVCIGLSGRLDTEGIRMLET